MRIYLNLSSYTVIARLFAVTSDRTAQVVDFTVFPFDLF